MRTLVNAVALLVTAWLVHGITLATPHDIESAIPLLIISLIFGFLNTFIKPVLDFFSAPLRWFTFGLFTWVINAGILLLMSQISQFLNLGFYVSGWHAALVGALVLAFVSTVLSSFTSEG